MKFETKFGIGDVLRFKWFDEMIKEKIRGVLVLEDKIYYQTENYKLLEENEVLWKANT